MKLKKKGRLLVYDYAEDMTIVEASARIAKQLLERLLIPLQNHLWDFMQAGKTRKVK